MHKKLDTFVCYFCPRKVNILWSNNNRLKEVVMLFLTTSKILCSGCSSLPLGKGYLSLILCPLPKGFDWCLFVTKNNSPGRPGRVDVDFIYRG